MTQETVWITGASAGIGEALALQYARDRARLVLSARREDELRRVAQRCIDAGLAKDDVAPQAVVIAFSAKWSPVFHSRSSRQASFLATATRAFFGPIRLARPSPQLFSAERPPHVVSRQFAAS